MSGMKAHGLAYSIIDTSRFYGRLAQSPDDHQAETLDAIKRTAHGLEGIQFFGP